MWRDNYFRVDSYVDSAVGIGYGEWFELEVGYQVGSRDGRSVSFSESNSSSNCNSTSLLL